MNKDFDTWNKVKKIVDVSFSNIKIREGEIRWCKFGLNIGNETLGKGDDFKRPVLILKKFSGDVFLSLPLTTKVREGNWYYSVSYKGTIKSIILNQARVLDRKRLLHKIAELSEKELEKVKNAYCHLILS